MYGGTAVKHVCGVYVEERGWWRAARVKPQDGFSAVITSENHQGEVKDVSAGHLSGCCFSSLLFLVPLCQLAVIHVTCQPTNAHSRSTPDSSAAGEVYL